MPEEENQRLSQGRLLGMDVGARRIGLAVSDPLGITAQGIKTLERKNKKADFAQIEHILRHYGIREIVVGYPLKMSGEAGVQSEKMASFAEELRRRFSLPVHLWDERLTTAEAHRVLDETEMGVRRRRQVIDQMAAVLILQSFLEARGTATS
jgi:putative Holliday junction resolvase